MLNDTREILIAVDVATIASADSHSLRQFISVVFLNVFAKIIKSTFLAPIHASFRGIAEQFVDLSDRNGPSDIS